MTGDLNLPFERTPGDPSPMADQDQATIAGGVVVLASVVTLGDGSTAPALVFRFTHADGRGFVPPIILVGDDQDLARLEPLVAQAIAAAREAAS